MTATKQRIQVRVIPREQMIQEWQDEIRTYELRYEMSSEKMATLVELDAMNHTAEVIRWYHTYYALKYPERNAPRDWNSWDHYLTIPLSTMANPSQKPLIHE